jgi:hypothetical protein
VGLWVGRSLRTAQYDPIAAARSLEMTESDQLLERLGFGIGQGEATRRNEARGVRLLPERKRELECGGLAVAMHLAEPCGNQIAPRHRRPIRHQAAAVARSDVEWIFGPRRRLA